MDNKSYELKSLDDILTEGELLDLLGIKKSVLDTLRQNQQLACCKITHTNRIYLVRDMLDFI